MCFEQRGFWSLCINILFEVEMHSKSLLEMPINRLEAWCMHRFPEVSISAICEKYGWVKLAITQKTVPIDAQLLNTE